jgi:hypothetical protein
MKIGFKDDHGGFYQCEVESEDNLPKWTEGMTRLTESERAQYIQPISLTPLQEILKIETTNPITHRALREFFIGFGEVNPAFKSTLLYQRVKAADDAIKSERAKL